MTAEMMMMMMCEVSQTSQSVLVRLTWYTVVMDVSILCVVLSLPSSNSGRGSV